MDDGGEVIFQLIMLCVFGGVSAAVANSKGRSGVGWFFGGFFLGCIGLVIILCLPNLREQQEATRIQEDMNRRLREQLRQEQMKVDALRAHTAARLDAHDAALKMDTRATAPALLSSSPPRPHLGGPPHHRPPALEETRPIWFYLDQSSSQQGPVTLARLKEETSIGAIHQDTLVWREGMADWTAAQQTPELQPLFKVS
ncbi:DUF4339 domain-containing protein [Verrucomicrobium spinosum]|uniref:DUF4339 domain-containing protein n=1 Tax=Verrucomicrobium spinosum TaxID=2736 RepID=UPI00017457F8|nr:DUF4339 domain-containing protein [Verrucomicrobium spinosum]